MWEKVISWLRWLWDSGQEVRHNSAAIRELDQNQRDFLEFLRSVSSNQNDLLKDNEMLRQQLQHERELRERDIKELKMELRLQISEELRRIGNSGTAFEK